MADKVEITRYLYVLYHMQDKYNLYIYIYIS